MKSIYKRAVSIEQKLQTHQHNRGTLQCSCETKAKAQAQAQAGEMVFAEYNKMGARYLFFLLEVGDGKLNSMKVM